MSTWHHMTILLAPLVQWLEQVRNAEVVLFTVLSRHHFSHSNLAGVRGLEAKNTFCLQHFPLSNALFWSLRGERCLPQNVFKMVRIMSLFGLQTVGPVLQPLLTVTCSYTVFRANCFLNAITMIDRWAIDLAHVATILVKDIRFFTTTL